jgi:membrane associated rhomboid family serine protease
VLPLRDDNPTTRIPFVTFGIIALNILAFVLWEPTFAGSSDAAEERVQTFFFCNAEIPYEVTHQTTLAEGGEGAAEAIQDEFDVGPADARGFQRSLGEKCPDKAWWQSVFVAMFLHGGWLHIGGNMLFLWVFGNNVEDKLGPIKYLIFYLAAGIAAAVAQTAIDPNSAIPNLGASGAIAGVLGAYILMFPKRRVLTLIIFFFITAVYLPAYVVLGLWFVLQLFNGVGSLHPDVNTGGGIAFFAHIGGFVFGALMALLFFPKERFGDRPPPRRPDPLGGRRLPWGRRRLPPPPPYESGRG